MEKHEGAARYLHLSHLRIGSLHRHEILLALLLFLLNCPITAVAIEIACLATIVIHRDGVETREPNGPQQGPLTTTMMPFAPKQGS